MENESHIIGQPFAIFSPLMGAIFEECCQDLKLIFEVRTGVETIPGTILVDIINGDDQKVFQIGVMTNKYLDKHGAHFNPDLFTKWKAIFEDNKIEYVPGRLGFFDF